MTSPTEFIIVLIVAELRKTYGSDQYSFLWSAKYQHESEAPVFA